MDMGLHITIYAMFSAVLFPASRANLGHLASLFRVQSGTVGLGTWSVQVATLPVTRCVV